MVDVATGKAFARRTSSISAKLLDNPGWTIKVTLGGGRRSAASSAGEAARSYELGKIIRSEYVVRECVWVLRVVDLCVESHEKHRRRPQTTEGMCDFGRKGEAVQGPLRDLDVLNAVGISI